jgi:pyruvate formate lyase activating enzyme
MYYRSKCILCGSCVKACGGKGISINEHGVEFDRKAVDILKCAEACPTGAMELIGQKKSIDEIIPVLLRDVPYFRRSGGGVTLSGGEPTIQSAFCREILLRLKELGINSAVETCGQRQWEPFYQAVEHANLILFDLKQMNPDKHKVATGVDNEVIIDNFIKLVPIKKIVARLPVIPGYNASDDHFRAAAALILNSGFKGEVHLLPYHSYGSGKYKALQEEYQLTDTQPPTKEQLDAWAYIFESEGLVTKIH